MSIDKGSAILIDASRHCFSEPIERNVGQELVKTDWVVRPFKELLANPAYHLEILLL